MTPNAPPSNHAIPMRPDEFVAAVRAKLNALSPDHVGATFTGITIDGVHAAVATRGESDWHIAVHAQHEHVHHDLRVPVELKTAEMTR